MSFSLFEAKFSKVALEIALDPSVHSDIAGVCQNASTNPQCCEEPV